MGTIALIGIGIFLGWVIFGANHRNDGAEKEPKVVQKSLTGQHDSQISRPQATGAVRPARPLPRGQECRANDHTLRNIAGGMVAGTILGHMLTGNHKSEAHETINNNIYNEYNDHDYDDWEDRDYNYDYDVDHDDDYEHDDYNDYDSYDDSYDDSDDYHDDGYDSYDSGSDWGSDSYDDGGDW